MKILVVSDEESPALWDYYTPGRLREFDLIISCGDLKSQYLQFLVTMARCPLLYVPGNHDDHYETQPPEGCDCIDDAIVEYNGIRIMGLGGCRWYHPGRYQYTEKQMRQRIRSLYWKLKRTGGVDILVTHAPPEGLGDGDDPAHKGFTALREFLDRYHPAYLLHGHLHKSYGGFSERERSYNGTTLINCCERFVLEIPDREVPQLKKGKLIWKTAHKSSYKEENWNL